MNSCMALIQRLKKDFIGGIRSLLLVMYAVLFSDELVKKTKSWLLIRIKELDTKSNKSTTYDSGSKTTTMNPIGTRKQLMQWLEEINNPPRLSRNNTPGIISRGFRMIVKEKGSGNPGN
ncbi:hypothetical protein ABFX02_06G126400 [Erythranthe guttata]